MTDAITSADSQVGPLVGEAEIAELEEFARDPEHLQSIADAALALLEPFRSFVSEDGRRHGANAQHRGISSTLTEQRRMDPAIADVVSAAFYDGELVTAQYREDKAGGPPPFEALRPLPSSPIVVVDFPHVSRGGTAADAGAEREHPRFHNPDEVRATVDVLRLLRPSPTAEEKPTVAILSFYKAQVEKLTEAVEAGMLDGRLGHLSGFLPATGGSWVSTVDGFQGNEADLVVLSLVRNNPGAGASALGFLRDRRRMNVALSRAKWKLVVVGSLSFLREAVRGVNPDRSDDHDLSFLTKVDQRIAGLAAELRTDGAARATLVTPAAIRDGGRPC